MASISSTKSPSSSSSTSRHNDNNPAAGGSPHRGSRLQDHHRAKDRWPRKHGKETTATATTTTTPKKHSPDPDPGPNTFLPNHTVTKMAAGRNSRQRARSTENLLSPSSNNRTGGGGMPRRSSPRSGSQPDLLRGSHRGENTYYPGRGLPPYQPELLAQAMIDSDEEEYTTPPTPRHLQRGGGQQSHTSSRRQSSIERYHHRHHGCHCSCPNKTLVTRREVKRTSMSGGSLRTTPINGMQIDDPPATTRQQQKSKQSAMSKAGPSSSSSSSDPVKSKKGKTIAEDQSGTRIQAIIEKHEPKPIPPKRHDSKMSSQRQEVTSPPHQGHDTLTPQRSEKSSHQRRDTVSPQRYDNYGSSVSHQRYDMSPPYDANAMSPERYNTSPQKQVTAKMSPQRHAASSAAAMSTMSPQRTLSYQRQETLSLHSQDALQAQPPHWDDTLYHQQHDDPTAASQHHHHHHQRGEDMTGSPPIYETMFPPRHDAMTTKPGQYPMAAGAATTYPRQHESAKMILTSPRQETIMYPQHETMTYPRQHQAATATLSSSPRQEVRSSSSSSSSRTPTMPRSISSQQLPTRRREAIKDSSASRTAAAGSLEAGRSEMERRRREHSSESSLARLDCVHARQRQLLQQHSSSSSFTSDDIVVLERYSEEPRSRGWSRADDAGGTAGAAADSMLPPRGVQHNECRKCVSERRMARRDAFEARTSTAVSTEIFLKEDAVTGKKQFVKISTV